MAEVKDTRLQQPMLDPIAYRSDYPKDAIIWNGEVTTENTEKYTGEWTKNVYNPYNKDLKIPDLDPNYQYGQPAKDINAIDSRYITTRNDNIASALYNEGKTTLWDVTWFLSGQSNWYNSTEQDRQTTINNVYNRIWEFAKQNEQQEQQDTSKLPDNVTPQYEQWDLYWKTTADEGKPKNGITPIPDANSIFASMEENRMSNLKALRSMWSAQIAVSIYDGTYPYGEQAYRDLQQYDMAKYQEVETEVKKLYAQDKLNSISHWTAWTEDVSYINSIDKWIDNDIKTWENANSNEDTAELTKGYLENKLSSNQTASSAKEQMLNIKNDIADLQDRLADLPNEARKAFKGDVPDYIYKAYIANNQQRIQNEISKLENRYAWLSDIYKTEVSNEQRNAEYNLKVQDFNRQVTNDKFNQYIQTAKLELDQIQWGKDSKWNVVWYKYDPATNSMVQVTDATAITSYNQGVEKISNYARSLIGQNTWKQCMGFTNMLTQQSAGVQMLSADWSTNPTLEERIEYATNPNVSDTIPVAGDVWVMISNGKNWVSPIWWHTVYVDKVYTDNAWNTRIHYIATNTGKEGESTLAYERDVSLQDWYNNGWVWFWNPFKQAQYNQGTTTSMNNYYSPMQDTIDQLLEEYKESGKTNMFSELWKFQELYTNLYQADKDWTLSAMIDSWVLGTFLTNVAFNWAQNQGWDLALGDDKGVKNFLKLAWDEMLLEAESYVAKNGWFKDDPQAQKAYDGFRKIVRAIQIKLRDESWAAINKSEWATDFLLFLPKASDSKALKESKLRDMEEYLRRMGTDAWISSKEYIPLYLWQRKYD